MANITAVLHPASGNSQRGRNPYYVDVTIDLTTNSIAPGDTIQAITVPANTLIMAAGFQVVESATMNTATDAIDGLALSTSGDTIDFVLAGSGASFTAGKLRAYAVMMDISDQGNMAADEVDRDTLA